MCEADGGRGAEGNVGGLNPSTETAEWVSIETLKHTKWCSVLRGAAGTL